MGKKGRPAMYHVRLLRYGKVTSLIQLTYIIRKSVQDLCGAELAGGKPYEC